MMRPLRIGAAVAAGAAVAVTAGALLALAASIVSQPATRAQMSLCAGSKLRTDRSAQALGISPGRADAFDQHGRLVWSHQKSRAGSWKFRPTKPGRYRLVYRRGSRSVQLDVLVARCSRELRLGLNGPRRALFSLRNLHPGATREACVVVTYTGNRPARVRLYGKTGGTGLDAHIYLTVVRGWTSRRTSRSCATFRPDRINYLRLGRGVVYAGTLQGLPDRFADAPNDATWRASRTWRRGTSRAYRLVVTLPRNVGNEAQGLTATQVFVWEARPTLGRLAAGSGRRVVR